MAAEWRDGWIRGLLVPRSLFGRLVAVNLLLSLLAIGAATVYAGWVFARDYEKARTADLMNIAKGVGAQITSHVSGAGMDQKAVEGVLRRVSEAAGVKALVKNWTELVRKVG